MPSPDSSLDVLFRQARACFCIAETVVTILTGRNLGTTNALARRICPYAIVGKMIPKVVPRLTCV